jgi:MvaI/BcnI restriction endonuclease family
MTGFDAASGKITDLNGGIVLLDTRDKVAALWQFTGIIEHWNRKHAQAAYIPSLFKTPPPEYRYGPKIMLCEGTDLTLFLGAVAAGTIYLDPGLKLTTSPSDQVTKKERHQFRIRHTNLGRVYHRTEVVSLEIHP